MKKILLLTTLSLSVFITSLKAQDKGGFKLGVGPVASLPFGDFKSSYSFGFGGEVQAAYGITDNIDGFVQAGYTTFIAKTIDLPFLGSIKAPSNGLIPALVGAHYHNSGFMIGAGIGYGKFTASGAGGGFAYSPQIGYSFGLVDVIANYTGVAVSGGSYSSAGLKVFINFIGGSKSSGSKW
jgi:hypothetical protein